MKKIAMLVFAFICLSGLYDTSYSVTFRPFVTPQSKSISKETIASDIVNNFAARHFEEVRKDFSPELKNQLPSSKIGEVWDATIKQEGAFQKVVGTTNGQENGYDQIRKRCQFENSNLTIEVTYNAEGKVFGLYIKP